MAYEISVAPFVEKDLSVDEDPREFFPSQGMLCEVEGCKSPFLKDHTKYRKHWRQYHVPMTDLHLCPEDGCSFKNRERCLVRKHLLKKHRVTLDDIGKKEIKSVSESNKYFRNPGKVLFRKYTRINTEAREKAKEERRKLAENPVRMYVPEPNNLSICRGQHIDFNFEKDEATVVTRW